MPKAYFFWDPLTLRQFYQGHLPLLDRAYYFTSLAGTEDELHQANVYIRERGFDPQIILEPAKLKRSRENLEAQTGRGMGGPTLEAADDLLLGLALGLAAGHIPLWRPVMAQTGDGDRVERSIGLVVTPRLRRRRTVLPEEVCLER